MQLIPSHAPWAHREASFFESYRFSIIIFLICVILAYNILTLNINSIILIFYYSCGTEAIWDETVEPIQFNLI